jgi:hypothetical protein
MKTNPIFLIIALIFQTQFSTAATFTWNGSVDTVFAKKANWTTANGTTYPGSNDTIYIVAATNRPVLASDLDVARLVLTSGSMDLKGYTFTATLSALCTSGTVGNGTLVVRGTKAQFSGSTINTILDVYCDEIIFDGGIFQKVLFLLQQEWKIPLETAAVYLMMLLHLFTKVQATINSCFHLLTEIFITTM